MNKDNKDLANIEERSNSFFEDILDDDPMADFPKIPQQLLTNDDQILDAESLEQNRNISNNIIQQQKSNLLSQSSGGINSYDQSFEQKELSFYGLNNIENIDDLIQREKVKKANQIQILRVMHCTLLTSLKGIYQFSKVKELNLSSNGLMSMQFLDSLSSVEVLNLSCNKITQVFNLHSVSLSLRKLNLSYNRIVSLQYFKEQEGKFNFVLEQLDLNGNYIVDLDQLKNLQSLSYLNDLTFQQNSGKNQICDYENYEDALKFYLPQVIKLDGKDIDNIVRSSKIIPQRRSINQAAENYNPNIQRKSPLRSGNSQINQKYSTHNQNGNPTVTFQGVSLQKELQEKDQQIQGLYNDIKDLHLKIERISEERNEAISKYDENEKYWQSKYQKLDRESNQLFEMNKSIKEDNNDILVQLDKFNKRIKQLESEKLRDQEASNSKDQTISELNKQNSVLVSNLDHSKEEIIQLRKDFQREQSELQNEQSHHRDTKEQLKQCQEKQGQLYQELMNVNKSGINRWNEIQHKYEETAALLAKQMQVNDDLNQTMLKMKDLNSQLEYSWGQKYESTIRDKEILIQTLKDASDRSITMLKHDYEKRINDQQAQFKQDILIIDAEMKKQRREFTERYEALRGKYQKASNQLTEMKEVLNMAVESDNKKDAMLEELKVAFKEKHIKLDQERDSLNKEQSLFELQRKEIKDELLTYKSRIEELEYYKKEQNLKIEKLNSFLNEKTIEYDKLLKEFDQSKRLQKDLSLQLENLNTQYATYDDQLKKDLEDARQEADELSELVKMKDRMLDDQNVTINNLKQQLKQKDDEIQILRESKSKYKGQYDEKLQQAYDDYDRCKQKCDDQELKIQELEEELDLLSKDLNDANDQANQARQQLKDRESAFEKIESEVMSIVQMNEQVKSELQEKEYMLQELRDINQELGRQNEIKGEEIRIVIERMEQYKKKKDGENQSLKLKIQGAESDIKILIQEQEKQKKQFQDKVKSLTDMFK
eukprot:403351196